jgi:tetratricopeptide (TPR) repeat protein
MIKFFLATAIALAAMTPQALLAKSKSMPIEERDARTTKAADFMASHKPADALKAIEPVVAAYDKDNAKSKKTFYCARSVEEESALRERALKMQQDAEIVKPNWCDALFIKGFVLIDLNRSKDAGPNLQRAATMAPLHSNMVSEYAEYQKSVANWPEAYRLFSQASDAVEFTPDAIKIFAQGRAWRGMGFSLIELNRLDEAEAMFKKALTIDPNDARAKNELAYIAQVRAAKAPK